MRSFSASSRRVWIQPWSRFMRRRLWRCRIMPATIPGMPIRLGGGGGGGGGREEGGGVSAV